ncbi:MAG: aldo/keto reductase, partial [Gemmatimonadales bacterium]
MLSRRQWVGATLGAAGALALHPRLLRALRQGALIRRAVPSTGEMLPVVGLGSSATFSQLARRDELDALREVIQVMVERGATVFDTAPSYGASEQVAGDLARERGVSVKLFWATKVFVAGRGGGAAVPAAARAQIDASVVKCG